MIMKTVTVTRLGRWYFVLILKRATVSRFKNSAAVYQNFLLEANEDNWPTWKSENCRRNPEAAYGKTSELATVFTVVRINFEKQYLNEKTEIIIMRPQSMFIKYDLILYTSKIHSISGDPVPLINKSVKALM